MQIKWKDEYSVNIAEIDKQHKKLFELAERVYTMANLDDDYDDYDEIMDVLKELKDYTVYHFGYEEQLMDKYGYERTEAHKIEHHFVVRKFRNLKEEMLMTCKKRQFWTSLLLCRTGSQAIS